MSKLEIFFLAGILIFKLLLQSPATTQKTCLTYFYIDQIVVMIVESLLQTRFLTLLPKTNSVPSNSAKNLLDQNLKPTEFLPLLLETNSISDNSAKNLFI